MILKPHDQGVSLSKANRTHRLETSSRFRAELGCVRRSTSAGELQSWSGAVTHRDTNRHLDKYTDIPRTQSLRSLTGSKQSLSLAQCSLSCSPSLSSRPHTHTTTVYQQVTSAEPEGSAEMNVKIDPDAGDCALGVSAVFCQCW